MPEKIKCVSPVDGSIYASHPVAPYGLTAAIWTEDADGAQKMGDEIATGTVFMNRCGYLDPGARLDRRQGHGPRRAWHIHLLHTQTHIIVAF
jgi:acyl-CoA reductase-like NAD-dependent aldehyde dehydrogenase